MPGKYSYNVVLADYSSQGLIPLPNDQTIQDLRDERDSHAYRAPRTQQSQTRRPETALSYNDSASRQRVRIFDSDTDEEPETIQEATPAALQGERSTRYHNKSIERTLQYSARPQRSSSLPKQPQEPAAAQDGLINNGDLIPRTRRKGGVRALIQARYDEELATALAAEEATGDEVHSLEGNKTSVPKAPVNARDSEEPSRVEAEQSKVVHRQDKQSKLSLHEFLNTIPRKPKLIKPNPNLRPRGPQRDSDEGRKGHGRSVSLKQFLDMVPEPPEKDQPSSAEQAVKQGTTASSSGSTETSRSPAPVSRLPKGVARSESPAVRKKISSTFSTECDTVPAAIASHRESVGERRDDLVRKQKRVLPHPPKQRILEQLPTDHDSGPVAPPISTETSAEHRDGLANANHEPRQAEQLLTKSTLPQQLKGDANDLDFDGFSDVDVEDSYFTAAAPSISTTSKSYSSQEPRRTSSLRTWKRPVRTDLSLREDRPSSSQGVRQKVHPPDGRVPSVLAGDGRDPSAGRETPARSLISSPKTSLTTGRSSVSPFLQTPPKVKDASRSDAQATFVHANSSNTSWGLPTIAVSDNRDDDLSKLFESDIEKHDGNILIFTSDEEEEDEDDLPTPRPQKLDSDIQFGTAQWGTISSGRQVDFTRKDADTMSELSAVFPPDIGRYGGSTEGGPLAVALAGMRHGGELGATYKPDRSSFMRRSFSGGELLQRLGLRSPPVSSARSGKSGRSGASGGSERSRQEYHRSPTARGRLPKNI